MIQLRGTLERDASGLVVDFVLSQRSRGLAPPTVNGKRVLLHTDTVPYMPGSQRYAIATVPSNVSKQQETTLVLVDLHNDEQINRNGISLQDPPYRNIQSHSTHSNTAGKITANSVPSRRVVAISHSYFASTNQKSGHQRGPSPAAPHFTNSGQGSTSIALRPLPFHLYTAPESRLQYVTRTVASPSISLESGLRATAVYRIP